ncbi:protein FATTY ACID EXPORT 1, chloroplastic-like isoform X3 [Tasmannia lanceolata]|uniref:protein FATTY ACID EXPORT 1, chloroplastic-like isoform X3 n=1 Tax=Tasmannia lanceolata TaxID=3420 RepID=UPI0040634D59
MEASLQTYQRLHCKIPFSEEICFKSKAVLRSVSYGRFKPLRETWRTMMLIEADISPKGEKFLDKEKDGKIPKQVGSNISLGGIVLSGGLIGFLFSRNPATLITGVLFGGALLSLSIYSLKVWRQGRSNFPFIFGQAALAAALLGKHFQTYSLTKKHFPTGFYVVLSGAMLCFYTYVLVSGGNPPPKKLKLAAS